MSIELRCEPISQAGFAPFGLVLPRPAPGDPRVDLIAELHNTRATAKPRLTVATVPPRVLPMAALKLERHVHSSQTFTPLDGAGYLVLVASQRADGKPDIAGLRAFHVPGDVGVHYFADTWHHPLTPLERPATFAILTFIDGGPTDEEWFDLPPAIDILA